MPDVCITPQPAGLAGMFAFIHKAAMKQRAWSEDAFASQCIQPGIFSVHVHNTGFILARIAADECEILTFAVHPDAQRSGLGLSILQSTLHYAAGSGCTVCFLEVAEDNEAARALYEKTGFRESGRRKAYYDNRTDALLFKKPL